MAADKYPSIFSRKMEAIVYIIYKNVTLFLLCPVLLVWMFFSRYQARGKDVMYMCITGQDGNFIVIDVLNSPFPHSP